MLSEAWKTCLVVGSLQLDEDVFLRYVYFVKSFKTFGEPKLVFFDEHTADVLLEFKLLLVLILLRDMLGRPCVVLGRPVCHTGFNWLQTVNGVRDWLRPFSSNFNLGVWFHRGGQSFVIHLVKADGVKIVASGSRHIFGGHPSIVLRKRKLIDAVFQVLDLLHRVHLFGVDGLLHFSLGNQAQLSFI